MARSLRYTAGYHSSPTSTAKGQIAMTSQSPNRFGARATLSTASGSAAIYRLDSLAGQQTTPIEQLPFTLRILVENALRNADLAPDLVSETDVLALARWRPGAQPQPGEPEELPFMPARVILQDFTGVPAVVDLAAMRDAVKAMGGNPAGINPLVPADLVIDHSVQVDMFGSTLAFANNVEREYERNGERYALLRWAQQAFKDFSVVPPGTGIVHQVNLEYLGKVVQLRDGIAFPDTLVGTDSHTTMINGLGVLGWGVGGIEAEAVLLGQPLYLLTPEVIGIKLQGALPEGATATDLVLAVTQMLRKHGVVGRFVEFTGAGVSNLSLAGSRHHLQHVARVRRHRDTLPRGRRDPALPAPDGPPRRPGRSRRALQQGAEPLPHRRDARSRSTANCWISTSPASSRASPARAARRIASPSAA